jgi:glycine cleavage system aminomethyltransferase T
MSYTTTTQTLNDVPKTVLYKVTGQGRSPVFLKYAKQQYPALRTGNTAYTVAINEDGTKTVTIWRVL